MLLFELESGNAALCAGGNARLRCTANGQCALFTVRLVGEAIPDSDNRNRLIFKTDIIKRTKGVNAWRIRQLIQT